MPVQYVIGDDGAPKPCSDHAPVEMKHEVRRLFDAPQTIAGQISMTTDNLGRLNDDDKVQRSTKG